MIEKPTPPNAVVLHGEDAHDVSDALADVLCWFRGFAAARAGDVELPPGIERLRELNIKLKRTF